jgi:hypothetical protein
VFHLSSILRDAPFEVPLTCQYRLLSQILEVIMGGMNKT